MSSSTKTTNYELSQFASGDKPAWLSDYNTDMSKIDTQMKVNADAATAASGTAGAATTAIGTLANLETESKTNLVSAVNEVNTKAVTAQNTANGATQGVSANALAIQAIKDYLNLEGSASDLTITTTSGTISGGATLKSAINSDGSLGKIYGKFIVSSPRTTSTKITISDTGLRPLENINIQGLCFTVIYSNTGQGISYSTTAPITIKTNGTCEITIEGSATIDHTDVLIPPCLLFMQNFGD